jgi:hypothetical protein
MSEQNTSLPLAACGEKHSNLLVETQFCRIFLYKSNLILFCKCYHPDVKTPPDTPEFIKFTQAMSKILKVSKGELLRRIEQEKREPKTPASHVSAASPKRAN